MDAEAFDRLLRTVNGIWPQIVNAGVDVVLDFGFWRRDFRDDIRKRAGLAGADTRLYWVSCPDDIALARCLQRNGEPGAFFISAQDFHYLKAKFEPPTPDEVSEVIDCVDGGYFA